MTNEIITSSWGLQLETSQFIFILALFVPFILFIVFNIIDEVKENRKNKKSDTDYKFDINNNFINFK